MGTSKPLRYDRPVEMSVTLSPRHDPVNAPRELAQQIASSLIACSPSCAFVGPHGRCTATAFLEFHHIVPFAAGGGSTVENIELRRHAHNQRGGAVFRCRDAVVGQGEE